MKRLLAVAALTVAVSAGLGGVASAHPLGNFTVNTFSGLQVGMQSLQVDYVIDMAEIPTFQARAGIDKDGDGRLSGTELGAYAASMCARSAAAVSASLDGRPLSFRVGRSSTEQLPGQAGLPTMRTSCSLAAPISGLRSGSVVSYSDRNFVGRIGWHEVTAVGDRTTITTADVPTRSISARLTAYPKNQLSSPLDQRTARLVVRPGGPAAGAVANRDPSSVLPRGIDAATKAFSSFVGRRHLGFGVGLVAVALALVLGALHAVAPGHGKTVMAAYLVGRRGSLRSALTLGATVTATHTAGVLTLGVILSVSTALAPERLFPLLGLASGLLLALIGAGLLVSALRGSQGRHEHDHHHPHGAVRPDEHAHQHEHPHPHPHTGGSVAGTPSRRGLVAMGLAGGMVPSPSALVVLLGAIALGRAWFGVVLVICYGLGMAATLSLAGLLLIRGREWIDRRQPGGWSVRFARLLPVGTAGLITVVGIGLALRAAAVVVA